MQDPNQTLNNNSSDQPKKSWFSAHHILGYVFLIAVLAAIIAGIYYWQTTSQIPPVAEFPVHKDEMAGWKTYTNTEYGFEFKYPVRLSPKALPGSPSIMFERITWLAPDKGGVISLEIFPVKLTKENVKSRIGILDQANLTGITVGGTTAYYFGEGDAGCGGADYRIPLNNSQHLSLRFANCELDEPYISAKEITQILSTFKFTDSTTSIIPGWALCNNQSQGYAFQYPKAWRFWGPSNNPDPVAGPYHVLTSDQLCTGNSLELSADDGPERDNPTLRVNVSTVTCSNITCTSVLQYFAGTNSTDFQKKWSDAFVIKITKLDGEDLYWLKDRPAKYVLRNGKLVDIHDSHISSDVFTQIVATFKFTK